MIEVLAQIKSPHFVAGLVLWRDEHGADWVIEAADILRYMRGWGRDRVRVYCQKKEWNVSVVHELERERPTWWKPRKRVTTQSS